MFIGDGIAVLSFQQMVYFQEIPSHSVRVGQRGAYCFRRILVCLSLCKQVA
jgi:hypothetical protein